MKLKPCPFCGGDGIDNSAGEVWCLECDMSLSGSVHDWNTRHYPQEITDALEAAERIIKVLPHLTCSDLHHNKNDRHNWDEDCPPLERYYADRLKCLKHSKS